MDSGKSKESTKNLHDRINGIFHAPHQRSLSRPQFLVPKPKIEYSISSSIDIDRSRLSSATAGGVNEKENIKPYSNYYSEQQQQQHQIISPKHQNRSKSSKPLHSKSDFEQNNSQSLHSMQPQQKHFEKKANQKQEEGNKYPASQFKMYFQKQEKKSKVHPPPNFFTEGDSIDKEIFEQSLKRESQVRSVGDLRQPIMNTLDLSAKQKVVVSQETKQKSQFGRKKMEQNLNTIKDIYNGAVPLPPTKESRHERNLSRHEILSERAKKSIQQQHSSQQSYQQQQVQQQQIQQHLNPKIDYNFDNSNNYENNKKQQMPNKIRLPSLHSAEQLLPVPPSFLQQQQQQLGKSNSHRSGVHSSLELESNINSKQLLERPFNFTINFEQNPELLQKLTEITIPKKNKMTQKVRQKLTQAQMSQNNSLAQAQYEKRAQSSGQFGRDKTFNQTYSINVCQSARQKPQTANQIKGILANGETKTKRRKKTVTFDENPLDFEWEL